MTRRTIIEIKGIQKTNAFLKGFSKKNKANFNDSIHEAGLFIEGQVKRSIAGRDVEDKSVDTGNLLRSPKTNNNKKFVSVISTNVKYANFIEEGGRSFTGRHHFRNTLARNKKKIMDFIDKGIRTK